MTEHYPRPARASDYEAIAAAVDAWWGRPVLGALPRLFLDHFHRTSLVIDGPGGPQAFLVGILSPSEPRQAYIHFAGVAPQARRQGLAQLWVNVKTLDSSGPWSEANMQLWNDTLLQACHQYPNLRVFDWAWAAQDGWFISDGIHYTPAGYAARAHLIAAALAQAFPASGASISCVIH